MSVDGSLTKERKKKRFFLKKKKKPSPFVLRQTLTAARIFLKLVFRNVEPGILKVVLIIIINKLFVLM